MILNKQTSAVIAGLLAALLVFGGSAGAWALDGPGGLEVGKPFPVITLPRLVDGEPSSIAEYRGEKLIMHIFASW